MILEGMLDYHVDTKVEGIFIHVGFSSPIRIIYVGVKDPKIKKFHLD